MSSGRISKIITLRSFVIYAIPAKTEQFVTMCKPYEHAAFEFYTIVSEQRALIITSSLPLKEASHSFVDTVYNLFNEGDGIKYHLVIYRPMCVWKPRVYIRLMGELVSAVNDKL